MLSAPVSGNSKVIKAGRLTIVVSGPESAFVNLDWAPTFTAPLLRKDMDLGLSAAEKLGVPLPVAATARERVQQAIDAGYSDCDFGILLELQAKAAGMQLSPENIEVDDGLEPGSVTRGS